MYNHSPNNYICPICTAIKGIENDDTWIKQQDVFYSGKDVIGFISSKNINGNEGHVLIVPNNHYENIYDLPEEIGHEIFDLSKKVAAALKETRSCDGVTILQNNEPAGDQHAFHYHLHVVPRFDNDNFSTELWKASKSEPGTRTKFAQQLRDYFNN